MLTKGSLSCSPSRLPYKINLPLTLRQTHESWSVVIPWLWIERKERRSAHGLLIPEFKYRSTFNLKKGKIPGFPFLNKEIFQVPRESRLEQSLSAWSGGQLLCWALSKQRFGLCTVPLSLHTGDQASRTEGPLGNPPCCSH